MRLIYLTIQLILAVSVAYSQNKPFEFIRSLHIGIEASPLLNFSSFQQANPIDARFIKMPFIGYCAGLSLSKNTGQKTLINAKLLYSELGYTFKNQNTYLPMGRNTSATISKEKFEFINLQLNVAFRLNNKNAKKYCAIGLGILHNPSQEKSPSSNGVSTTKTRSIDRLSQDTTTIAVVTKGRDFQVWQMGVVVSYSQEVLTSKKYLFEYFISARLGISPVFRSSINLSRQNY